MLKLSLTPIPLHVTLIGNEGINEGRTHEGPLIGTGQRRWLCTQAGIYNSYAVYKNVAVSSCVIGHGGT